MGCSLSGSGLKYTKNGEAQVYTLETIKTISRDGIASDIVLLSGIAGKEIEIHSVYVATSEASGVLELNEETSDTLLFKAYFNKTNSFATGDLHLDLASGKDLLLTCPANTFILITYHYEDI